MSKKKRRRNKKYKKIKATLKKVLSVIIGIIILTSGFLCGMFFNETKTLLTVKEDPEAGLYEVNFTADYKLDRLLLSGGITTEKQLTQYITDVVLKGIFTARECKTQQFESCSFYAAQPEGGGLFGENISTKETDFAVVKAQPKNGYTSVSVVDLSCLGYSSENKPDSIKNKITLLALPYFPLEGMNETGLVICLHQISAGATNQEGGSADVTATLAVRSVLDKCATVAEAIRLLGSFDMHFSENESCQFQIADDTGSCAIVSYINNEMTVTEKELSYQCASNFYPCDVPFEYEIQGEDSYKKFTEILNSKNSVLSQDEGMELLRNTITVTSAPSTEEGTYSSGCLSAIYDINTLTLTICSDLDYEAPYSFNIG